MFQMNDDAKLM